MARLAVLAALFMTAVIVASAFLRLANAGLDCADWPACYGRLAVADDSGKASGMQAMRAVHRISATAVLLVSIALVVVTMGRRPRFTCEGRGALTLLGLSLALAVLGWATRSSALPAVVLTNLLGGFAMLTVAWQLGRGTPGLAPVRFAPELAHWLNLGIALLIAEIVIGGLISAQFAARSCLTLPACGSWPEGEWLKGFDVFRRSAGDPLGQGDAAGVALHLLHRALALIVAAVLGTSAWRTLGAPGSAAILVLLFIEFLLGAASLRLGLPLLVVVAHNLAAALLLAAAVGLRRAVTAPS